jgi:hypothetical protein
MPINKDLNIYLTSCDLVRINRKSFQWKTGSDDWGKWNKTGGLGWECVLSVNRWRRKVALVQKPVFCTAGKATSHECGG